MNIAKTIAALGAASTAALSVALAAPVTLQFEGASRSGATAVAFELVLEQGLESIGSTGGPFGAPGPRKLFDPADGVLSFTVTATDLSSGATASADLADFAFDSALPLTQFEGAGGSGALTVFAGIGANAFSLDLTTLRPGDPGFVPDVLYTDPDVLLGGLPTSGSIELGLLGSATLQLVGPVFEAILAEDPFAFGNEGSVLDFDLTSIAIRGMEGPMDGPSAVPVPAAALLFVPGLGALAAARRRRV